MKTRNWMRIAVVLGLIAGSGHGAEAVVITVNTTNILLADDGACSLPEAIVAANNDTPSGIMPGECPQGAGADVIELANQQTYLLTSGPYLAVWGASGLPAIASDITINAHSSLITRDSGAPQFRIFEITEQGALHLNLARVERGHAEDNAEPQAAHGGCFLNRGQLHLDHVDLDRCQAGNRQDISGGGHGGAIYTTSSLEMLDSSIKASAAGDSGAGGNGGSGGAIFQSDGTTLVTRSNLLDNHAGNSADGPGGDGGAIALTGGLVMVHASSISANSAGNGTYPASGGFGGGISLRYAQLELTQSSISLNSAGDGGGGGLGGGIAAVGGSIHGSGCTIEGNQAGDALADASPGNGGDGGGLYSSGYLELTNCSISANSAGNGGPSTANSAGGLGGNGGAIHSYAGANLSGCVVDNNHSGNGGLAGQNSIGGKGGAGALSNETGTLYITDTTISNNEAGNGGGAPSTGSGGSGGDGGGINAQGTVQIRRSAFIGNLAGKGGNADQPGKGGNGGGLFASSPDAIVGNATISGNHAGDGGDTSASGTPGGGGNGGGVFNDFNLELKHVTISDNSAGLAGAALGDFGGDGSSGGLHNRFATTLLANTIIANSSIGFDCVEDSSTLNDAGGNFIESGNCGLGTVDDPRLAPLDYNGGPTMTHSLCTGVGVPSPTCPGPSSAIDIAPVSACSNSPVDSLDQRGASRPGGADCDSGAFESAATAPVLIGKSTARPGGKACIPVSLVSGAVETVTNRFTYDAALMTTTDAEINVAIGAGTTPNKTIARTPVEDIGELISVIGTPGELIPTGLLYTATIKVAAATPTGNYAVDPSQAASLTVTSCTGDCNGSGAVTVGEVQRCVNHFLGTPLCSFTGGSSCPVADANNNGSMSIGEVQQCVNFFLSGC